MMRRREISSTLVDGINMHGGKRHHPHGSRNRRSGWRITQIYPDVAVGDILGKPNKAVCCEPVQTGYNVSNG